ncbi:unnamed protein product [Arctia plantaginis]|uniref:Peptidase aspartic putative domain-containing protein n=1 Tax=Arctia plantaginis TaxID=874455 RepID=A0A8S0ZVZ1_ARCPL|nr:unnamed protein product [Arctia plantaginis]
MEELLVYQKELLENLKRAEKNYKKSPKDRIKAPYLETRLESLEDLWKAFKEGHKHVISKLTKDEDRDDSYFIEDTYEEFEELYIQYKSSLKEALQPFSVPSYVHRQTSTPVSDLEHSTKSDVKLPRIQIPKFSGRYEEWQSFYDLFSSLIHNNKSLSPVQKLQYLKSNLSGEPEVLLRNFTTTNANYDEAWNELEKRYNNKRYNANEFLRTLFTQKNIQIASASSIKQLVDTTSTCLKALKNMDVETDTWDMIINYLVLSKLDTESVKEWEQYLSGSSCDLPTWPELRDFLRTRFRSLEMMDSHKPRGIQFKSVAKPKSFHSISKDDRKRDFKCALCNGDHYVYHCKKFGDMSTKERQDFVQQSKLCFNCLAPSHTVVRCRQAACCRTCGRRHHTLLHFVREANAENTKQGETSQPGMVTEQQRGKSSSLSNDTHIVTNFSRKIFDTNSVLLATARVSVDSRNGCKYLIRALLDQGSQASFVTEATVQLLNLTRRSVSGWVSGVGEGQTRIKHMVSLIVKSRHNPEVLVRVNAYVLRSLTTLLPSTSLCTPEWEDIKNLELADPGFMTPGKIDILLGAEVYSEILLDGLIKHPSSNLLVQNTILGWVISGRMSQEPTSKVANITSLHVQHNEDEILKLFWEVENEPNKIQKRLSEEEKRCEELYDETTVRNEDGSFVVRLPFKHENLECQNGKLREIAAKRFEFLEKRLSTNRNLREEYHRVINEYIRLKHMVQVESYDIDNPRAVYLPHHAVSKEDKDTTKLRVVFDASCKGVNNVSLNDELLVGPKLQQDLRHILMRWRTHKICISADIIKMYRMVHVAEEDSNYQRILWRFHKNPLQRN